MNAIPPALAEAIEALGALPGVGPRSAERFAYYLFKSDPAVGKKISRSLDRLHDDVAFCEVTFALIPKGQKHSRLYNDPSRDKSLVAVVAEPFDIMALEKTGHYKGTYHVLGGLISPIDGIGPEQLKITELIKRIKSDKVKEIILATNGSVEGETTALYIQQQLSNQRVKISRLAQGLPVGVDIEYADQITLSRALEGRTIL